MHCIEPRVQDNTSADRTHLLSLGRIDVVDQLQQSQPLHLLTTAKTNIDTPNAAVPRDAAIRGTAGQVGARMGTHKVLLSGSSKRKQTQHNSSFRRNKPCHVISTRGKHHSSMSRNDRTAPNQRWFANKETRTGRDSGATLFIAGSSCNGFTSLSRSMDERLPCANRTNTSSLNEGSARTMSSPLFEGQTCRCSGKKHNFCSLKRHEGAHSCAPPLGLGKSLQHHCVIVGFGPVSLPYFRSFAERAQLSERSVSILKLPTQLSIQFLQHLALRTFGSFADALLPDHRAPSAAAAMSSHVLHRSP